MGSGRTPFLQNSMPGIGPGSYQVNSSGVKNKSNWGKANRFSDNRISHASVGPGEYEK
jgi:hypothetical protein